MVFKVPRLQDDHGGQNPCILHKIFETEVLEEERYHQQKKKKKIFEDIKYSHFIGFGHGMWIIQAQDVSSDFLLINAWTLLVMNVYQTLCSYLM